MTERLLCKEAVADVASGRRRRGSDFGLRAFASDEEGGDGRGGPAGDWANSETTLYRCVRNGTPEREMKSRLYRDFLLRERARRFTGFLNVMKSKSGFRALSPEGGGDC